MTDFAESTSATNPGATGDALPQGEAFSRGRPSIVWLIPVIALLVGGWLAYKTWSEKGPTVDISFKAAAGLQVGKTVIKFKDVEVGKVTAIRVADDLKRVLVTAELAAGTEPWLTKGTRFWIARPRVAAGRVSGLDTLLSGAFIEIDPVTEQDGFKVVPTVPASLEAVAAKVNGLLDTVGRLPLEEIASNVLDTVGGTSRLVNSKEVSGSLVELERLLSRTNSALAKLDSKVLPEASAALNQARGTLRTAQELVAKDSTMVAATMRLLRELSAAARSVKGLAEYLERHPEALIKGKGTR